MYQSSTDNEIKKYNFPIEFPDQSIKNLLESCYIQLMSISDFHTGRPIYNLSAFFTEEEFIVLTNRALKLK